MTRLLPLLLCFAWPFPGRAQQKGLTQWQQVFAKELTGWTRSFSQFQLKDFVADTPRNFEDIPYQEAGAAALHSFYAIYKPALSFSPGKKQFLDIYSYQLPLEKEKGRNVCMGAAPNQAITLYNQAGSSWNRILFFGTSSGIEKAAWMDDYRFILAGISHGIDDKAVPMIYTGDTRTRQLTAWHCTNPAFVRKKSGYTSPKLKRLRIVWK